MKKMSCARDAQIGLSPKVKAKKSKHYSLVKTVQLFFAVKVAKITGNLSMVKFVQTKRANQIKLKTSLGNSKLQILMICHCINCSLTI